MRCAKYLHAHLHSRKVAQGSASNGTNSAYCKQIASSAVLVRDWCWKKTGACRHLWRTTDLGNVLDCTELIEASVGKLERPVGLAEYHEYRSSGISCKSDGGRRSSSCSNRSGTRSNSGWRCRLTSQKRTKHTFSDIDILCDTTRRPVRIEENTFVPAQSFFHIMTSSEVVPLPKQQVRSRRI